MNTLDKLCKPKYIRVCSDLHLEQLLGQREEFLAMTFVPEDPRDAESVLVLAGDISSKPQQLLAFLGWAEKRFLKVIYVPGNHEFYGHEMGDWTMDMVASIEGHCEKVEFSGCGVICEEMEGLRIIATTFWADGGSTIQEAGDIGNCLNDFRIIKLGDRTFTVDDMKTLHRGQKAKVKEMLEEPFDGKTVVVTHHLPSYSLCHPRFGSAINGGFASHSDELLHSDHAPDVWIIGHTHDTIDRDVYKTRVVCNASGYRFEYGGVHNTFGPMFLSVEDLEEVLPVQPMWHSTPKEVKE